ncbi:MAG: hypothetical protein MJY97_01240 [Bacteroidales bacterium]|nr:hypothetical protein [Bacteroidales bacterium]
MKTVFIIRIEEETIVFSSRDKARSYLANHAEEYLLEKGDIDRLLCDGAIRNYYADFFFGEYEVI